MLSPSPTLEARSASAGASATLVQALAQNAREAPTRIAFRERAFGIWQEWRWPDALEDVLALAAGFEAIGLRAEEALIVVGDNRARIYFSMLAAMALRAY